MVKYNTLDELIHAMYNCYTDRDRLKQLEYASEELRSDPAVFEKVSKICRVSYHHWDLIKYAMGDVKRSHEKYHTIEELIEGMSKDFASYKRGEALQYATDELRGSMECLKIIAEKFGLSEYDIDKYVTDDLKKNKDYILYFNIPDFPEELLEDRDFVLQYMKLEGHDDIFGELSEEFKDDKEIVLQHMASKGNATDFETISKRLQSDMDVLLAATKSGGFRKWDRSTGEIEELNIFDYIPEDLKNNRTFILQILSYDETGKFFENFPDELKHDKEVVLAAVKNYGLALEYVPDELKKDREIVLAAVQSNGIALRVVPDELKNDREVVLEAIKNNIWSIKYIGEDLRGEDASIFAYGVREGNTYFGTRFWNRAEMDGKLDTETMERFKNNKEISMAFVINHLINEHTSVPLRRFAPDEICNDKSFIMDTIQYIVEHGEELTYRYDEAYRKRYPEDVDTKQVDFKVHVKKEIDMMLSMFMNAVDKSFYEDEEIMYLIAENSAGATFSAGGKFKSDLEFALRAVRTGGKALDWFTDEIRDNDEVAMVAVKRDASQYRFVSERLRGDISVFLEAITQRDKDGEVIGVDSLFDMYTLPYAKIKFDNDILGQMIRMPNGERVCQVFLDLYKKGGLLSDEERDVLQFFIEELDEKMKNPDIDDEKNEKIKKIRDDVNQYVNIQWQYFVDEYNRQLENPDIDDETKESIRSRRDRMIAQIQANNKQHSASEVAELDGVKTSDIQTAYEETIAGRDTGKEDKTKNISDE